MLNSANNYLDSYIVIPKIELTEKLGIDEYHSPNIAYRNSAYICVMVDGKTNTLNDVLGSRSKIQLGNYLSAFPKEEREKVKTAIYDEAKYRYDDLAERFRDSGIAEYREFVDILCTWKKEILN